MPSQFGGILDDEMPKSQFGGILDASNRKNNSVNEESSLSVVGDIFNKRANELADNIVAYQNNEKSLPELGLNFIGKAGAGTANDLIGAGINAATPDMVKHGLASGAQNTATVIDSTKAGQYAGDKLMAVRDLYNQFTGENPRIASALESVGNLATIYPAGRVASEAASSLQNVKAGLEGLAGEYAKKYPAGTGPIDPLQMKVSTPIDRATTKNAGSNAFKDAEILGGTLSPLFTSKALNILNEAKQQPIAGKVLTSENKAINDALGEFDELRGSYLTLDDYHKVDSSLGDKAAQAFVSGNFNKGRIVAEAQDKIREALYKLSETEVMGGKEGFDVLTKDAIPLWAAQAKLADIEKILDRANAMDNRAPAIRTGLRNLMLSNRFKKYPSDVQKLIQKSAASGNADDLLGILGSRLNVIAAGGIGGLPGAVLSLGMTKVARGMRNQMKRSQANKINTRILEPVRPSVEKYNFKIGEEAPDLKEIMAMPPAQARAYLAKFKQTPAPLKR